MNGRLLIPLLLLLCATAAAEPMMIGEDTECVGGEMRVDDHLTIQSGARLLLQDCVLVLDDGERSEGGQWYTNGVLEGLVLHVEEGATLELRSVDAPAGMRAAGGDYAYSLRVDGDLVARGTPEHPVQVGGLEGYFLEQSTLGGIEVFGTATLDHVAWAFNQGPSLLVKDGNATVANATVERNTGAFAVRQGGSLALRGVDINVGNVGFIAADSRLDLEDVSLLSTQVALKAVRSDVTVRGSTLDSVTRGSAELTDTDLLVEGSLLRFGPAGIVHAHDEDFAGSNAIVVRDSVLEGRDWKDSMAVTAANVDLTVERTTLRNYTYFGINHGGGTARLVDNVFEGRGKYHAYLGGEPTFAVHGNSLRGDAVQGIVYAARVFLDVVDRDGPVANATVELPTGAVYRTGEDGVVGMVLTVALDAEGEPVESRVPFVVGSEGRVKHVQYEVGEEARLRVDLDATSRSIRGVPGPGVAAVLAAVAVLLAVRRR